MWYIYTVEYYSAIKKNEMMPFAATCMQLEIITKWSKSDRERQIPYDITYMWSLKYDTNQLIYKTETDSQNRRTDLWLLGEWGAEGEGWVGSLGSADANYYI